MLRIGPEPPPSKRRRSRSKRRRSTPFNPREYFLDRVRRGCCRECGRKRNWAHPTHPPLYAHRCEECEQKRLAWVKANYGQRSSRQFPDAAQRLIHEIVWAERQGYDVIELVKRRRARKPKQFSRARSASAGTRSGDGRRQRQP